MDRRLNRLHVWLLTAALCFSATALRAHAQIVDIPESVRTTMGAVSDQDKANIKAYIDANSKNLLNGAIENAENLRKDRNALLKPLHGNVSASFRLAYDAELQPHTQQMLASDNMKVVINGLVLAGAVATDRSLAQVVAKLNDKLVDVRFEAAVQLGFVFRTFVANEQRAINPGNISPAVRSLEQLIANEVDPNVRAELIRTGLAAADIQPDRNAAITAVARGVSTNLRKAKLVPPTEAELNALLRAGVGLRDVCTKAVQQNVQVAPDACRAVAEMGGCILGFTAKVVPVVASPAALPNRPKITQLAASAQTAIELAGQLLGQPKAFGVNPPANLVEVTKAGDAKFVVEVGVVNTELTKPPFDVPADRLK